MFLILLDYVAPAAEIDRHVEAHRAHLAGVVRYRLIEFVARATHPALAAFAEPLAA